MEKATAAGPEHCLSDSIFPWGFSNVFGTKRKDLVRATKPCIFFGKIRLSFPESMVKNIGGSLFLGHPVRTYESSSTTIVAQAIKRGP